MISTELEGRTHKFDGEKVFPVSSAAFMACVSRQMSEFPSKFILTASLLSAHGILKHAVFGELQHEQCIFWAQNAGRICNAVNAIVRKEMNNIFFTGLFAICCTCQ
jgi:hypothetical protein